MNTLLTSAVVLADSVDLDSDTVTPGVLGFLMVAAIGTALYFLMRNMSGKLGTIRGAEEAEREAAEAEAEAKDARAQGDQGDRAEVATAAADAPEDDPSGPARGAE